MEKTNKDAKPDASQNPPVVPPVPNDPKPHKPSNYVKLAEGQSDTQSIFASMSGSSVPVAIFPKHGKILKLVDEDTSDADTIARPMGVDLVNKGIFVFCDAPDKDAPAFVEVHDPATPQGNLIQNGILTGDNVGMVAVSVNGGKEQVFVPAPFVSSPDGYNIPVAPQIPVASPVSVPAKDVEPS